MTASEIAALINALLDIDDMTAEDNFFDAGGNSLLALALIAKIEERCGVKISLLDVIRAPTPSELESLIVRGTVTKAR